MQWIGAPFRRQRSGPGDDLARQYPLTGPRWIRGPFRTHNRVVPTLSSDDAFAEVKAKVDLVKVVSEHVRLTKKNRDLVGLCPFHQEDTPSFTVHPDRQFWYCFGCGRSGDVFTFVEL